MSIEQAAINLAVAFCLSAVIGFERQWRNRLAGLRTNTLVALGAASFVVFAALAPEEASPTRVAAQVVSGIGFLGAGLIFREGMSVRGLNTAATLWCSAAIGVLAGAGYLAYAALATGFVVFVNLLLRPIVNFINRQPLVASEIETGYLIVLTCRAEDEAHIRALLLQGLAGATSALRGLDSSDLKRNRRRAGHGASDGTASDRRRGREDRRAHQSRADHHRGSVGGASAPRSREPIRAGPLKGTSPMRSGRRIEQIAAIRAK